LDVETSIKNSLENLGVDHVDLYLVHQPRLAVESWYGNDVGENGKTFAAGLG